MQHQSTDSEIMKFRLQPYWRTTIMAVLALIAGIAIIVGIPSSPDLTWEPWLARGVGILILFGGMTGLFWKEETVINLANGTFTIKTGWFTPRKIVNEGKFSDIAGMKVYSRYPEGRKLPVREFAINIQLKSKDQTTTELKEQAIAESFERSEMLKLATELSEKLTVKLSNELPAPRETRTITLG